VAGAEEALRQADLKRMTLAHVGAEGGKDFQVRVDLADPQAAALAVGSDAQLAQAVEQGRVEQHRRAHVLRQLVVGEARVEAAVVDLHRGGSAVPFDPRALLAEKAHELFQVRDIGHILERDRLVGEQGGAEDGQRGVLVAGGDDGAGEGLATVDDEVGHG